jgi:hypothetical protein
VLAIREEPERERRGRVFGEGLGGGGLGGRKGWGRFGGREGGVGKARTRHNGRGRRGGEEREGKEETGREGPYPPHSDPYPKTAAHDPGIKDFSRELPKIFWVIPGTPSARVYPSRIHPAANDGCTPYSIPLNVLRRSTPLVNNEVNRPRVNETVAVTVCCRELKAGSRQNALMHHCFD